MSRTGDMPAAPAGAALRAGAEALAAPYPPLLAAAERLAAAVQLGAHGRRRAGMGDEFWQYRAAHAGDSARAIDWRRSARSDAHFVREREWQAAQSVTLWVDTGRAMSFASDGRPEKGARARLLALALAILLLEAGERVGLAGALAPGRGRGQMARLAEALARPGTTDERGALRLDGVARHSQAVLLSDFLGDLAPLEQALAAASRRRVRGALMQVLDPAEETFPFAGRVIFESMAGALSHETLSAGDLATRYRERLRARKERLFHLAETAGWRHHCHHTGTSAAPALMWLARVLEPAPR